jgi:heptose-I-phosphate ethanolaminephosphotransferase
MACSTLYCQGLIAYDPAQYINIRSVLENTYLSKVLDGLDAAARFTVPSSPIALQQSTGGASAQAILLVLGESASRLRMGSYGYSRNTTPLLGSDAHLFQDALAVGLNTQPNVQALFTGRTDSTARSASQDIFRVAKAMGYKTVFIDNNGYQKEDPVVKMASTSDTYISMNSAAQTTTANDDKIKFDKVLFEPFSRQLEENKASKAIYILHIAGSHPSQDMRYPKNFAKFPSWYDNSILYTDYVVNHLKTQFMNAMHKSAVAIYVADHGVVLPPGCGLGKIPMPENSNYGADDHFFSNYAVPLIVWTNPAFEARNPHKYQAMLANLTKPVDHRFLLYTLGDLMGLASINQTAIGKFSIFSPHINFMPRKNTDGDNVDELIRQGKICRGP